MPIDCLPTAPQSSILLITVSGDKQSKIPASVFIPCVHVGLAADYSEIIWNQHYRVPSAANDDVCDYPLARNLVMLTVAVACEVIVTFAATKEQQNLTCTIGDFAVKPLIL